MKSISRIALPALIGLSLPIHATLAAGPYGSLGVAFASEEIGVSTSGVNHPTGCNRLLYADPCR